MEKKLAYANRYSLVSHAGQADQHTAKPACRRPAAQTGLVATDEDSAKLARRRCKTPLSAPLFPLREVCLCLYLPTVDRSELVQTTQQQGLSLLQMHCAHESSHAFYRKCCGLTPSQSDLKYEVSPTTLCTSSARSVTSNKLWALTHFQKCQGLSHQVYLRTRFDLFQTRWSSHTQILDFIFFGSHTLACIKNVKAPIQTDQLWHIRLFLRPK